MLLASFIYGLAGQPGRQTRYVTLGTIQEALKIALLVEQAEKLEKHHGVFLIEQKAQIGHKGAEPQGRALVDQAVQMEAATICYRCRGVGHVARNCLTRKRKNTSRQVEGKDRDSPTPLLSVYTAADFQSPKLRTLKVYPRSEWKLVESGSSSWWTQESRIF
jgi:hypothetical protein